MTTARFGIVFLPGSLTLFGDLCREAEANGFDWLGVADSQSVFRELYVALTLAALNTGSALLGPVVTNPLTRHLVVTASVIHRDSPAAHGRRARRARGPHVAGEPIDPPSADLPCG